jgi:hypothetical protein
VTRIKWISMGATLAGQTIGQGEMQTWFISQTIHFA